MHNNSTLHRRLPCIRVVSLQIHGNNLLYCIIDYYYYTRDLLTVPLCKQTSRDQIFSLSLLMGSLQSHLDIDEILAVSQSLNELKKFHNNKSGLIWFIYTRELPAYTPRFALNFK